MVSDEAALPARVSTGGELCAVINRLEAHIAEQAPEVRWTFIEPDTTD